MLYTEDKKSKYLSTSHSKEHKHTQTHTHTNTDNRRRATAKTTAIQNEKTMFVCPNNLPRETAGLVSDTT